MTQRKNEVEYIQAADDDTLTVYVKPDIPYLIAPCRQLRELFMQLETWQLSSKDRISQPNSIFNIKWIIKGHQKVPSET